MGSNVGLMIFLAVLQFSMGQDQIKIVGSVHYRNFQLVSNSPNAILSSILHPGSNSKASTRFSCMKDCMNLEECQAFNLYTNHTHHLCELLADNLCLKALDRLTLVPLEGSSVWDKVNDENGQACIDQLFQVLPENHWCEIAQPGCAGTWPHCDTCAQTCLDCAAMYHHSGTYGCVLRPEGHFSQPIFAHCINNMTILMERVVHPTLAFPPFDYMMSFKDMNRLTELRAHQQLQFMVLADSQQDSFATHLELPHIDPAGTLRQLPLPSDMQEAEGVTRMTTAAPFVVVPRIEDLNNCGSFWRLNPNNPLNCPGGAIGMFGRVKRNKKGIVERSGIRFPIADKKLLIFSSVVLK